MECPNTMIPLPTLLHMKKIINICLYFYVHHILGDGQVGSNKFPKTLYDHTNIQKWKKWVTDRRSNREGQKWVGQNLRNYFFRNVALRNNELKYIIESRKRLLQRHYYILHKKNYELTNK